MLNGLGFGKKPLRKGEDGDAASFLAKVSGFGHNDMCLMPTLTMPSILANLMTRFRGEIVYTYVGDIVVSLNPFKNVGCVGADIRRAYQTTPHASLPPHQLPASHISLDSADVHSRSPLL